RLAMERRRHGRAGIAGGGDQNRQRSRLSASKPRQRRGQKTRTEILERGRRSVEKLQNVVITRRERIQRRGKVEGFATDRLQFRRQRIAVEERTQPWHGTAGEIGARRMRLL